MMTCSLAILALTAGTAAAHDACSLDCPHAADLGLGVRSMPMPIEDLPQGLQDTLATLAQRAAAGEVLPMMCVSPDTDPKVAAAFNAHLQQLWGGGPERYVLSGPVEQHRPRRRNRPAGQPRHAHLLLPARRCRDRHRRAV